MKTGVKFFDAKGKNLGIDIKAVDDRMITFGVGGKEQIAGRNLESFVTFMKGNEVQKIDKSGDIYHVKNLNNEQFEGILGAAEVYLRATRMVAKKDIMLNADQIVGSKVDLDDFNAGGKIDIKVKHRSK